MEKHTIQSVVLLPPKLTNLLSSFKVIDPSLLLLKVSEFIRYELQRKQAEREMDEEEDASETGEKDVDKNETKKKKFPGKVP